jgi:hypothetical protein
MSRKVDAFSLPQPFTLRRAPLGMLATPQLHLFLRGFVVPIE